jgi:hypothetical protein
VIVTSQGTAAAITGQGWGATAAQDAADNNYVGVGGSAIQDPYFDQWGNANFWASDGTGPLNSVTVNLTNDNVPYLRILGGTFTANSQYRRIRAPYVSGGNHAQFLNVQQGDRIGWSAMCGLQAGTGIIGYIEWRNAAGGWVASNSITKNLGTIGTGTGPRSTFDLVDFYADAPAGAAYAFWAIRAYGNTGQAPDLRVLEPQLSRFAPGQVRMPPFMPGSGATRSADQTAVSTAAAIAGQGGQATANASRGPLASRPASPPEGSWYTDTTNNDLQFYTGGTWYKVADVGGSGTFSATISPSYAYGFRFGAGTCTSNVVTAAGSNGSGNYSYLWSMDPSYGIGFTQSASSATQAFTKTMAAGDEINATAYCNVTDDDTGQVIQVACNVRLVAA